MFSSMVVCRGSLSTESCVCVCVCVVFLLIFIYTLHVLLRTGHTMQRNVELHRVSTSAIVACNIARNVASCVRSFSFINFHLIIQCHPRGINVPLYSPKSITMYLAVGR